MYRKRLYANVHATVTRYRGMVGKEIHGLTRHERLTLRWLHDLELL